MPATHWAFIRPADPGLLDGRPILDLGAGDGQTLAALSQAPGLIVGLDRSLEALRARRGPGAVCADARAIPVAAGTFQVVLAGDLFHHLDDHSLAEVLEEVSQALGRDGRLVAWWYARPGRGGPGDPRYPRAYEDVATIARGAGLEPSPLELKPEVVPTPVTVGMSAVRA